VKRGAVAPLSTASGPRQFDESELDQAVRDVADKASQWSRTTPRERADCLSRVVADTFRVSPGVERRRLCAAKGYDPQSPEGGEELFSGVGTFVRWPRPCASRCSTSRVGRPLYPGPVRAQERRAHRRAGGARRTSSTGFSISGVTAEVWMEPGVDRGRRSGDPGGPTSHRVDYVGVSLVLGAGNVASLGPRDALTKMFAEGKVVVLKANPVNDYLVPYWREPWRPHRRGLPAHRERGRRRSGVYLDGPRPHRATCT
jgi:hypothetical protein